MDTITLNARCCSAGGMACVHVDAQAVHDWPSFLQGAHLYLAPHLTRIPGLLSSLQHIVIYLSVCLY